MRFTGEHLDPTGLYYLRARQYDPGTGGFLGNDPVKVGVGDPYVSEYIYVNQRPTVFVDPSGEIAFLPGVPTSYYRGAGRALGDIGVGLRPDNFVRANYQRGADAYDAQAVYGRGFDGTLAAIDVLNPIADVRRAGTACAKSVRAGEAYKAGRHCTAGAVGAAVVTAGVRAPLPRIRPSSGFHYTNRVAVESIKREGLRRGSFVTTTGRFSPSEAHLRLSLDPDRAPTDVVLRVDLAAMRRDGLTVPRPTRVGSLDGHPATGGGRELYFEDGIAAKCITEVR